jgi:hypothetical protein
VGARLLKAMLLRGAALAVPGHRVRVRWIPLWGLC